MEMEERKFQATIRLTLKAVFDRFFLFSPLLKAEFYS
jgi:hypothetical protein